jgi:hypothetical protein
MVAADTLREYWPVFTTGAAVELWLVRRLWRRGRFPFDSVLVVGGLALLLLAVLWSQSFLATQFAFQTLTEDRRVDVWGDVRAHLDRSWPLLAPLVIVLVVLAKRPRSHAFVALLVAAAGFLVSWLVAMWLFTTTHHPLVFQLLVLPGGLGLVASLAGYTAATAMWMGIARWIWKEGRRRRSRPPTSYLDVRPSRRT